MSRPTHADVVPKPGRWIGTSKEDLSVFPDEVRRRVGRALSDAQIGLKAPFAKPLKGFGGAGVPEVVDDFDGNAHRSVYGAIRGSRVRTPRIPEEVDARDLNAQVGA
jgi:phage-related protein